MRQSTVTFAMRDFDRLKCIQAVIDSELKPIHAAERLGLTTRQVRRLARRYAAAGPVRLVSKRFSQPGNNRLHDAIADQVIKLLKSTYTDFGARLAAEKLRTKHGIDLAKETVRQLQIAVCLWIPRKLRPPKIQQPQIEAGVHRRARSDRWLRTSLVRRPRSRTRPPPAVNPPVARSVSVSGMVSENWHSRTIAGGIYFSRSEIACCRRLCQAQYRAYFNSTMIACPWPPTSTSECV